MSDLPKKDQPTGDSDELPSVEKQQEALLKKKYGNLPAKSGSRLLQNRLHQRGANKYFDSGDYNMARAKMNSNSSSSSDQKPSAGDSIRGTGGITGDHMPTPEELPRMRKSSQSNLVIPGKHQSWFSSRSPSTSTCTWRRQRRRLHTKANHSLSSFGEVKTNIKWSPLLNFSCPFRAAALSLLFCCRVVVHTTECYLKFYFCFGDVVWAGIDLIGCVCALVNPPPSRARTHDSTLVGFARREGKRLLVKHRKKRVKQTDYL